MESFFQGIDNMCIGEICSVLYRQYQSYIITHMKEYQVNSSETMFLVKLSSNPVSQKQVSDSLCFDYAIATRSLCSLEEKGLIHRVKSEVDGRKTMVSLTEKGEDIRNISMKFRKQWKQEIMEDISEAQEEELFKNIKNIAKKAIAYNIAQKESK